MRRPASTLRRAEPPQVRRRDAGLEQGLAAVTRLQQDVLQSPLDSGHSEEVLTFSAGLVQWRTDEALGDLLTRASRALGLARRGGVGKVVVG
jgi:diguanylate cyclase